MAYPGATLAGFLEAYDQAGRTRRLDEAAEQARRLNDMRLTALGEEAKERAALPGAISALMNVQPTMYQPTTMPTLAPPAGAVEPTEGLGGIAPAPTPAGPPVSGIPLSSLSQALSPEQMALLMKSPAGHTALKARGVITDEEFQKRKAVAEARVKYNKEFDAAMEAFKAGDSQQGILHQTTALRSILSVVDPEHAATMQGKIDDLTKYYLHTKKDDTEKRRQDEDGQAFARAMLKFKEDNDLGALLSTVSTMRSTVWQRRADEIVKKVTDGLATDLTSPNLQTLYKTFADNYTQAAAKGERLDPVALWRMTLQAHPEAVPDLIIRATDSKTKGDLPEAINEALFGYKVPKNDFDLADRIVRETLGVPREDPRYAGAVAAQIRKMHDAKKSPEADRTRAALLQLHRDQTNEINNLRTRLASMSKDLSSIISEDAKTEIESLRQALRNALTQRKATSRQLADFGINQPDDGLPAEETVSPLKAVKPPPTPTRDDYRAEFQRLMGAGHTLDSAKDAMRQMGWK